MVLGAFIKRAKKLLLSHDCGCVETGLSERGPLAALATATLATANATLASHTTLITGATDTALTIRATHAPLPGSAALSGLATLAVRAAVGDF